MKHVARNKEVTDELIQLLTEKNQRLKAELDEQKEETERQYEEKRELERQLEDEQKRRAELEESLHVEKKRRAEAEDLLKDVERECRSPFVVPALLQAYATISNVTSRSLVYGS